MQVAQAQGVSGEAEVFDEPLFWLRNERAAILQQWYLIAFVAPGPQGAAKRSRGASYTFHFDD